MMRGKRVVVECEEYTTSYEMSPETVESYFLFTPFFHPLHLEGLTLFISLCGLLWGEGGGRLILPLCAAWGGILPGCTDG